MPIYRGISSSTIKDGSMTLFWKDDWLDSIKSEIFPRAFSYCTNEDIFVQQFLSAGRLADNFWLPLSPEALEEVREMQNMTTLIQLTPDHDTWIYTWGDKYTPSRYYNFCFRNFQPHVSFLWLWKSKCTPKVKFFFWLVLFDRLNTRNMLRRRQFHLNSGYRCLMCANPLEETVEHMLFHCPFSQSCWQILNMDWDLIGDRLHIIERGKSIWQGPLYMEILMLSSWNIWKERNMLLFDGITPSTASWRTKLKTDLSLFVHRTKSELHPVIYSFISRI
jgi:hypothetical protein